MRAVVRTPTGVSVRTVATPAPGPREVAIRVQIAGVCRTDLAAADGIIGGGDRLILGHELCGVVAELGEGVDARWLGRTVAAAPWAACGRCAPCATGGVEGCIGRSFLGVDRDGAFAERVVLPVRQLFEVPDGVPSQVAAYLEPVAAALAVCEVGLPAEASGLIVGRGRIARLLERVLTAKGYGGFVLHDPGVALRPDSVGTVIEAGLDAARLAFAVDALAPGGTLVLKSRPTGPVPLDVARVVNKRLRLVGANYGSFSEAMALLATGRVRVDDLVGEVWPLSRFAEAFDAARDERDKPFLAPE
jgi:threonine dehydrogenase-like Zn-dependent dehydrogenase